MNKIVQKWQFQKTFYTTMETVLGFSQNRLAELFQNYVFSTNQYLYFDLYVAECQIQFFWPASRFGVYVVIAPYFSIVRFLLDIHTTYFIIRPTTPCMLNCQKHVISTHFDFLNMFMRPMLWIYDRNVVLDSFHF